MAMADGPASTDPTGDALAEPVARDRRPSDAEQESVKKLVGERRKEVADKRDAEAQKKADDRNAARREKYANDKPTPYAALAGREELSHQRVIAEGQTRLMELINATGAPGADHSLVKLRGRETELVEAWKTLQLFRVATKREPTNRDLADNAPSLMRVADAETRLRKAARLRSYIAKLEASGVWKPFDLLCNV